MVRDGLGVGAKAAAAMTGGLGWDEQVEGNLDLEIMMGFALAVAGRKQITVVWWRSSRMLLIVSNKMESL